MGRLRRLVIMMIISLGFMAPTAFAQAAEDVTAQTADASPAQTVEMSETDSATARQAEPELESKSDNDTNSESDEGAGAEPAQFEFDIQRAPVALAEPSNPQKGDAGVATTVLQDDTGETGLRGRLMKLAGVLFGIVVLLYVMFYGFRRTPIYKQMATNPVKMKSVTPTGGKTKLLMVEVYGSHLLLAASDQSLSLIKAFEPDHVRQYEREQEQLQATGDQAVFEAAMAAPDEPKAGATVDESSRDTKT